MDSIDITQFEGEMVPKSSFSAISKQPLQSQHTAPSDLLMNCSALFDLLVLLPQLLHPLLEKFKFRIGFYYYSNLNRDPLDLMVLFP